MKRRSTFSILQSRVNTTASILTVGAPPVEIQQRIEFYYQQRISLLESELKGMTLEEHAYAIIDICRKISHLKKQVSNQPNSPQQDQAGLLWPLQEQLQ
ncbi:MAG: hypothetical protein QM731_17995 [Chitinophagaceae bacterium]